LSALALVVLKVWGGDQAAIDNLLSLDLGEVLRVLAVVRDVSEPVLFCPPFPPESESPWSRFAVC